MMDDADDAMVQLEHEFEGFVDRVFEVSQDNLVSEGKVDTGNLLTQGHVRREGRFESTIIYPVPYADAVHWGRLPGSMPPSSALEKWVRRKLQVSGKDVKGVAFAIALEIKKRGVEAFPFLTDAMDQVKIEYGW